MTTYVYTQPCKSNLVTYTPGMLSYLSNSWFPRLSLLVALSVWVWIGLASCCEAIASAPGQTHEVSASEHDHNGGHTSHGSQNNPSEDICIDIPDQDLLLGIATSKNTLSPYFNLGLYSLINFNNHQNISYPTSSYLRTRTKQASIQPVYLSTQRLRI